MRSIGQGRGRTPFAILRSIASSQQNKVAFDGGNLPHHELNETFMKKGGKTRAKKPAPSRSSVGRGKSEKEKAATDRDRLDRELGAVPSSESEAEFGWSKPVRRLVSLLILAHLFVVVIGPLANPIGFIHLTKPLARLVAPMHQALFLGHGYRFFGPDPGPGHLVFYRGTKPDGSEFEGVFPDREKMWPRLQYHRWFMLSETIYNERNGIPSPQERLQLDAEYENQIKRLTETGQSKLLRRLKAERTIENHVIDANLLRYESLIAKVAAFLAHEHEATTLELSIRERAIPFPEEIQGGLKLNDPSLLGQPRRIGRLASGEFQLVFDEPLEEVSQ